LAIVNPHLVGFAVSDFQRRGDGYVVAFLVQSACRCGFSPSRGQAAQRRPAPSPRFLLIVWKTITRKRLAATSSSCLALLVI